MSKKIYLDALLCLISEKWRTKSVCNHHIPCFLAEMRTKLQDRGQNAHHQNLKEQEPYHSATLQQSTYTYTHPNNDQAPHCRNRQQTPYSLTVEDEGRYQQPSSYSPVTGYGYQSPPHRSSNSFYSPTIPANSRTIPYSYSPTTPFYSPSSPAYYSPTAYPPTYSTTISSCGSSPPSYSPTISSYSSSPPTYSSTVCCYSPSSPDYSPTIASCDPPSPSYSPTMSCYSPSSFCYSPTSPCYSPTAPYYSSKDYYEQPPSSSTGSSNGPSSPRYSFT